MINPLRSGLLAAGVLLLFLGSPPAVAGVCIWGECSEMTNEFRNLELRPQSIALLPARTSLTQDGVFGNEDKVGETALDKARNKGHQPVIEFLTPKEPGENKNPDTLSKSKYSFLLGWF